MSLQSLLNPTPPSGSVPRAAAAAPPAPFRQQTWLIVGASRGIGLEFCTQLLAAGHRVVGTARAARGSSQLWTLTGTPNGKNLTILECDVTDEASVERFVEAVRKFGLLKKGRAGGLEIIDVVVLNAGVLVYPNRAMEISYKDWAHHLTSNTIGPLMVAQRLLRLSSQVPIHTLVFMSSDSGSTANFRAFEDGFAAYAASKAALNQGLRHLTAELHRAANASPTPPPYSLPQPSPSYPSFQPPTTQFSTPNSSFPFPSHQRSSSNHSFSGPYATSSSNFLPSPLSPLHPNPYAQTQPQSPFHSSSSASPTPPALSSRPFPSTVLALHPGEVSTDMANVALGWEVEGIISPAESVRNMLRVIEEKGYGGADDSGARTGRGRKGEASFWTWEGRPYPW